LQALPSRPSSPHGFNLLRCTSFVSLGRGMSSSRR
jgi:hypothetical protein